MRNLLYRKTVIVYGYQERFKCVMSWAESGA
jgi:hypothetical protein